MMNDGGTQLKSGRTILIDPDPGSFSKLTNGSPRVPAASTFDASQNVSGAVAWLTIKEPGPHKAAAGGDFIGCNFAKGNELAGAVISPRNEAQQLSEKQSINLPRMRIHLNACLSLDSRCSDGRQVSSHWPWVYAPTTSLTSSSVW